MLAMADTLFRAGKSFAIHYCGRRRDGMAFCTSWRIALLATASICTSARKGKKSVLTRCWPLHHAAAHVYVCGPEGFMDGIADAARGAVIRPNDCIRSFNREVETGGASFTVDVPGLGVTVTVGEDETIVAALRKRDQGQSLLRTGSAEPVSPMCDGVPDHRDEYLTDEEREDNDQILLCCSRAKTPRLVIESFEYVKLK